jgi:hypothetical protein
MLKKLMDDKGVEYNIIDDESVFMPIADKNNILSMPFAEVDGNILNTKELQKHIMED